MKRIHFVMAFLTVFVLFFSGCNKSGDSTNKEKENEDNFEIGKLNSEAPPETKFLGQLAGSWNAEQTIIGKDGTWEDGRKSKAIWRWYYILDGHAIQDDWISIDSLNRRKAVGTNIRIYNSEDKLWYMAWIDKTHRRLATFTATNDSGNIVMDGTNSNGRHIHNTFYNIKQDTFDWKQEWTFDKGESWVEVARIHCVRKVN